MNIDLRCVNTKEITKFTFVVMNSCDSLKLCRVGRLLSFGVGAMKIIL